jgi:hypothetical protein
MNQHRVPGWTVSARPGRVYLHPDGDDVGRLTPDRARELAEALTLAADQAAIAAGLHELLRSRQSAQPRLPRRKRRA